MAMGEVGKVGVAVNSLRDMETLLEGVFLDRILQVRTTANAIGPIMVAFLLAWRRNMELPPTPSRSYPERAPERVRQPGRLYLSAGAFLKLATDVVEYCCGICGSGTDPGLRVPSAGAGSTASQEVAFAVANALAYLQSAMGRGLTVDEVARNSFSCSAP